MFIPNLSFWFVKSTSPHGVCACCLLNVSRSAVVTCVPVVCGTDTISMCPAISIWVNWWNHVWFLISTPPPLPGLRFVRFVESVATFLWRVAIVAVAMASSAVS